LFGICNGCRCAKRLIAAAASAVAANYWQATSAMAEKSMHKKCKLIWGLGLFLRQLIRTRGSAFSSGSGSGFDFAICAVARRGIPIPSPTRG